MRKLIFFLATFFMLHCFSVAVTGHAAAAGNAGASSGVVQSLSARLETWDVEEVWPEIQEALSREPQDPDLLEIASHIAFHRGDYRESINLIKMSMDLGGDDDKRKGIALFVEETINVLAPYKRHETPLFIILLDENQDGILLDYLTDALEKTYQAMVDQYGFRPKEKVRVELFPDANEREEYERS